jgi:hypothetical protein
MRTGRSERMSGSTNSGAPRKGSDDVFIEARARGRTCAESSAEAGFSERTGSRRLSEPTVANRIRARRRQLVSEQADRLTALTPSAIDVLGEGLAKGDLKERVAVAKTVLVEARRVVGTDDLEERLAHLDAVADGTALVFRAPLGTDWPEDHDD